MFSAIASITAVCVALAVSGWNPTDDVPTFPEDPTALALINGDIDYFSSRIDHVLAMVTGVADWIMFYGDRVLTDVQYPHLQMCECVGTQDDHGTFFLSKVWRTEKDPNKMYFVYQVFRGTPEMLLRLSATVGMIPVDHVTAKWSSDRSLFPKFSPSVYLPPRRRSDWGKLTLDIRHLLLAFILHFAIKGFKGWCYGKTGFGKTDDKTRELADKDLDNGTVTHNRLNLLTSPEKISHLAYNQEFSVVKPIGDVADRPTRRRYVSTNPHGFSNSWYKIIAIEKTPSSE